jgi:arylsulfatase A
MQRPPNIVLILADDMGYGDLGAFNDGLTHTPALNSLLQESTCLTQHYAASPVCNPSRASLLTGRYPHRTGSIDTLDARGLDRLALRETTLADHLRRAGYATGLVGKWHLGRMDRAYHPLERGFDEFVGFQGGWSDYYRWHLQAAGPHGSKRMEADGRYLTDVFTEEALSFVQRHAREPFFLHLCYNAPHFPFQVPRKYAAPFLRSGDLTPAVCAIYGMIKCMDEGIDHLLDELDRQGIADNTLLLFTSDNGPQFGGEGDMCTDRFNAGLAGSKGLVYDGGIRVPAILRWPDGLAPVRELNAMVHFADWLPTLLEAAGVEPQGGLPLDGRSALPVLRGRSGEVCTRRFWQWTRYRPRLQYNAACRDGDWKLVRPAVPEALAITDRDGEVDRMSRYEPAKAPSLLEEPLPEQDLPRPAAPQLFNLADDPNETQDLADAEPDRLSRMLADLEQWFHEVETERSTISR